MKVKDDDKTTEVAQQADVQMLKEESLRLEKASKAADELLDLVPSWASLHGAATKNLGSALRAKTVRDLLNLELTAAKLPLLRELEYIARAADVRRHLSCASIADALQLPPNLARATDICTASRVFSATAHRLKS